MAHFQSHAPQGQRVQELELLVRTALFKSASALVGVLLQQAAERSDAAYQPKPGEQRKGRETLQVQCLFGTFPLARDYYYHPGKHQGHSPADAALGLEVGYTPALARLICLEGADAPGYEKAQEHLAETGGIAVSARQIQRVVQRVGQDAQAWQERAGQPGPGDAPIMYVSADGTGVPMRRQELAGRKGKQPDGTAKTRQVYLGCVFTQHRTDEKGHPVRDYESTTYVSSFKSIDDFGPLLRQEAIRRGMGSAGKVVVLIDGARGLENMGQDCFKDQVQIVDFYHTMEHAGKVLEALIGKTHPDYKKRLHRWAKRLLKDKVQALIEEARQECAGQPQKAEVEEALGYFARNVARMQYGTFRAAGYFIGSGVVEAGCKTVIGGRCKQSGMFWSRSGAENILALRCIHSSRRLDEYWKHRLNQHAKLNDCLSLSA
ncbi:MAG TPA: ISKra4 family transposase [Candidatus Saccharimonadales bacterium]|jgi:hypothetical protein|nr:ISKra4 family transposase [Candidatus Saccharimonadales bacterium]